MRLIDADALKGAFYKAMYDCISMDMDRPARILNACINRIDEAPTIEVVPKDFHDKTCEAMVKRHTEEIQRLMPKRGEWKHGDIGVGYYEYPCCSKCGYETEEETNFCPNCGAKMTEREGE